MRIVFNAAVAILLVSATILSSIGKADSIVSSNIDQAGFSQTIIDIEKDNLQKQAQPIEEPIVVEPQPVRYTRSGDRIVTSSRPDLVITPIVETIRHNTLLINFSRSETDSELSFYHDNIATTQSATQVMLHELAYSSTEQPWTAINQWLLSRVPEEQQIHHTINLEVLPVDVDQFICLATNIYYEARGSSYDDQRAVALVTLNRARHWRWEGSICDVVWERYQFSWTITADHASRRVRENNSWETSQLIAYEVLTGGVHDITEGATNYYNPSVVRPRWGSMAVNPLRIGAHRYMQLTTTTNYERPENVPESNRRRLYSRAISRILN